MGVGSFDMVTVVCEPWISLRELEGDPILLHRHALSEHIYWSHWKHSRLDCSRK